METGTMIYQKGLTYKMNPEIEESDDSFTLSHYNEYGSAFFHTINDPKQLDEMFWLSSEEVNEDILVLA